MFNYSSTYFSELMLGIFLSQFIYAKIALHFIMVYRSCGGSDRMTNVCHTIKTKDIKHFVVAKSIKKSFSNVSVYIRGHHSFAFIRTVKNVRCIKTPGL